MKFATLITLCCLVIPGWGHAQDAQTVKHEIVHATVFLAGAQVTRTAKVQLKSGENLLRFDRLATGIQTNSIQASAPSRVLINSVSYEVNHLDPVALAPQTRLLQDSLDLVSLKKTHLQDQQAVLHLEKNMIKQNQSLGGTEQGVSVEELQKAAEFFRTRLLAIQVERDRLERQEKELDQTIARLKNQLQRLNSSKNQPSNDILVLVRADQATTAEIKVSYLVQGAGWVPTYDLRVTDTDQPLELTYRAEVYQTSGVDWNDVKLTLSTANPRRGANKPELSQWNLYLQAQAQLYGFKRGSYADGGAYMADQKESYTLGTGEVLGNTSSLTLADFTNMSEGATTTEFAIDIPQNVPATGESQQVAIQNAQLPAFYEHLAVPRLDPDAFLQARVTDWEQLNLLPGKANVFFEGTFVAESYINPSLTRDTLDFSLGRDPRLVVERNQLKDHNKTRTLGANRERTFGYELLVRNTKSTPVQLQLKDQVPVSQNDDITIKVIELDGGSQDKDTGVISWDMALQPGESKTFRLIYSVKYPKNANISGL